MLELFYFCFFRFDWLNLLTVLRCKQTQRLCILLVLSINLFGFFELRLESLVYLSRGQTHLLLGAFLANIFLVRNICCYFLSHNAHIQQLFELLILSLVQ